MEISQIEQIKVKLRAFSERYDRKIETHEATLISMHKKECAMGLVIGKKVARTSDDNFFKALFADELL